VRPLLSPLAKTWREPPNFTWVAIHFQQEHER
jgi:hypothetical protein